MFWPLTDRLPLCKSGPNTVVFPFLPFDAKRDITNALTELNWQIHSLECPLRCFDDSNPWSDSVPLENDSNGGDSVEEWMRGEGAYLRLLLARPSVIPARRLSKQMEMTIVCRSKWFQDIILKKLSWRRLLTRPSVIPIPIRRLSKQMEVRRRTNVCRSKSFQEIILIPSLDLWLWSS